LPLFEVKVIRNIQILQLGSKDAFLSKINLTGFGDFTKQMNLIDKTTPIKYNE